MRSRVLALYIAIRQGTAPVGAPLMGWIGGVGGARAPVLLGGVITLVAGIGAIALLRSRPSVQERYLAAIDSPDG